MEAIRRTLHVGFMLATLIGLSLMAFLVIANLIWVALFAVMIARLSRKGALQTTVAGFPGHLRSFFRDNRKEVVSGGTYAVNEYLSLQLRLCAGSAGLWPWRADHHPRHPVQGDPRRDRALFRGLRRNAAAPDPRP